MSEAGSSRVTTVPDRSTGVTESLPLATRYRNAAPIEWQGNTVYPMYTEQLPTSSSALSIALLSATPPPGLHSFGLGLSVVDGYIGLDGRRLDAVDIWRNALTGGITFELSATVRGALFTLTPVWTDTEGEPLSWLGNYGVVVDRRTDNRVVLRCSIGEGPPDFTDLVVEVRTAPTDTPTAPQPKLTTPPTTPEISMPFGAPVPSTPSSLPAIAPEPVADDHTPAEQPPSDTPPSPPVSTTPDSVPATQESGADSIFGSPIQWEPPIEADQQRAPVFLPPDPADELPSATSHLATVPPPVPRPNSPRDQPSAENDARWAETTALATGPSAPTVAVPTDIENGPAATAPATDAPESSTPHRRRSTTSPSGAPVASPAATPPTPVPVPTPYTTESNDTSDPGVGASTAVPGISEPAQPETTPAVQSTPLAEKTDAPANRQPMRTPPTGTLKRFGAASAAPTRALTTAPTRQDTHTTDPPDGTDNAVRTNDDADQADEAEAEPPRTVRLGHLTLTTSTRDTPAAVTEHAAHEDDDEPRGPEPVPSTIGIVAGTETSSPADAADRRIADADQDTTPLRPFEAPTRKDHSYRNALYDLAVAMHGRGEQEQAYGLWAQAASAGHAEAAYDLGVVCFRRGDLDEAERWWRTAAHRRVMRAMAALAELLDRRGDHAQARLWRNQAATEYAVATQDRNALEQQDGDEQPVPNRDQ